MKIGTEVFPIRETNGEEKMMNISPTTLPHFHGLTFEDLDTFMFEFSIACRTYDYASDEKKLKLFTSNLRDAPLHWFMALPGGRISTYCWASELIHFVMLFSYIYISFLIFLCVEYDNSCDIYSRKDSMASH